MSQLPPSLGELAGRLGIATERRIPFGVVRSRDTERSGPATTVLPPTPTRRPLQSW